MPYPRLFTFIAYLVLSQLIHIHAGNGDDAVLPKGLSLKWGEEPVTTLSPTRGEIVLNGLWKFMPAKKGMGEPAESGWGYIWVPGSWKPKNTWRVAASPGLAAKGRGAAWQGFNPHKTARAWYQRSITIPRKWAGRAIELQLPRVSTDAAVFLDGKKCGEVHWPGGTVDLTGVAEAGKEQNLRIEVVATNDQKMVKQYMADATSQVLKVKAELLTKGITGDVILMSRPRGPHIAGVFVQPSTRKKEVTIDVELSGVTKSGSVTISALMFNGKKVEKKLRKTVDVAAKDEQVAKVSWPWGDPRLWSPETPELYTVMVGVQGAGMKDAFSQEFGFREFWIEGRKFFLNGKEIRLRPVLAGPANWTVPEMRQRFTKCKELGFNFAEYWPNNVHARGFYERQDLVAREASRAGFMVSAEALYMPPFVDGWINGDAKAKEAARKAAEYQVRRFRNYPAVVIWFNSGNYFGAKGSVDPQRIGQNDWMDVLDVNWNKRYKTGMEGMAMVKEMDPTRPFTTHSGAMTGDIYTRNHYLNFIPLQEREEWLSEYAEKGTMPYLAVEFGAPLHFTMHRSRGGVGSAHGAMVSEPMYTEFGAVYLGNRAYELEEDLYRKMVRDHFQGKQRYRNFHGNDNMTASAVFTQLMGELWIPNTWRTWRAYGLTGGLIPWAMADGWKTTGGHQMVPHMTFKPGERGPFFASIHEREKNWLEPSNTQTTSAGKALMQVNGPTLAWLGGAPEHVDKTHNFYGGSAVKKQIVLTSDVSHVLEYKATWSATLGGRKLDGRSVTGKLDGAQDRFLPIQFKLPQVTEKTGGKITLAATIAGRQFEDTFDFSAFPQPTPAEGTVAVFDRKGLSSKMLEELGYTVKTWDGNASGGLLVIGREAIKKNVKLPGDLKAFVSNGGRLIMCAQQPEVFDRMLGLRVSGFQTRYTFPVNPEHPALAGLTAADLTNWAGTGTLVPPKPDHRFEGGGKRTPGGDLWYGVKWGNRHTVSSAAIEKPHHSSWRPIIECEFDLSYSPLMEMEFGKGRMILCTLDLEDQVPADPAARVLAQAIVDYAMTSKITPKAGTVIALGDVCQLDSMAVICEKTKAFNDRADVVILGPGANVPESRLQAFAQRGGKVLVLADDSPQAPLGAKRKPMNAYHGSLEPPTWPEAAGLSASDLRWKTDKDAILIANGCEIGADGQLGRKVIGKGVVIYSQLDPQGLNADEKDYFRYTRWRQTRALAQVLSNLGVSFKLDSALLTLRGRREISLAGDWKAKLIFSVPEPEKWGTPEQFKGGPMKSESKKLTGPNVDTSDWVTAKVPGEMETYGPEWKGRDGEAVFQVVFNVPADMANEDFTLSLSNIHHCDFAYINGTLVGKTGYETKNWWTFKRFYDVPGKLLKPGKNVLTVVVQNDWRDGGFVGNADEIKLTPKKQGVEYYHNDYRADYLLGDDPYRYHPW